MRDRERMSDRNIIGERERMREYREWEIDRVKEKRERGIEKKVKRKYQRQRRREKQTKSDKCKKAKKERWAEDVRYRDNREKE